MIHKYYLVEKSFKMPTTLYQPIDDMHPSLGAFPINESVSYKKGDLIPTTEDDVPVIQDTSACVSIHGGKFIFHHSLPKDKVVLIPNVREAVTYQNLKDMSDDVKYDIKFYQREANKTEYYMAKRAKNMDDILYCAKRRLSIITILTRLQYESDRLDFNLKKCRQSMLQS